MVLIPRRAVLGGLAALLAGCVAKRSAPVSAAAPLDTTLCAVLQRLDSGGLEAVPPALAERLAEELGRRNLVAKPPPEQVLASFANLRTSPQRLAWLAEQPGAGPLLVLVAAQVEFYSQMNGRWRWTVSVELTIAPRTDLGQAVSSTFSVPVFMQFHHEREPEALVEAAPVIERELGYLLDQVIGGLA